MSRLPDWEQRLQEFLVANMDRPFVWGSWDCALFAAYAVEAMTGEDFGAPFRAISYTDKRGAAEALRTVGAGTLVRELDSHFSRKPIGIAQRGDLVMVGTAVGICAGRDAWFVGEEELFATTGKIAREGLIRMPRRVWAKAWGV